jgi:hypothetical protein
MDNPFCKLILISSMCILVNACSSTKHLTLEEAGHQYCETEKVMVEKNGKLEAVQVTKCTDNPVKKLLPPKMGVGKECRSFLYNSKLGDRRVERVGYACLMKGKDYETSRWYIVQSPYHN